MPLFGSISNYLKIFKGGPGGFGQLPSSLISQFGSMFGGSIPGIGRPGQSGPFGLPGQSGPGQFGLPGQSGPSNPFNQMIPGGPQVAPSP